MKKIHYFLLTILSLSVSCFARAEDCTTGPAWTFDIENNTGFSMSHVTYHNFEQVGFSTVPSPIPKFSHQEGKLHYCCGSQHWTRVSTIVYEFSDPQKNQCAVSFSVSCTPQADDPTARAPHVSLSPNVVCTRGSITSEFSGGGTSAASEPVKFKFMSQ